MLFKGASKKKKLSRFIARLDKFFKKHSIIAQFKALNERISEWAYFLTLIKNVLQKRGVFWIKVKGQLYTWSSINKTISIVFLQFSEDKPS